jgi:hypothetical protein
MPVFVPFARPSFAPDEERRQPASRPRTGQHEPLRSATGRIAARGTALGVTVAAGAAGAGWLQHDLEAGLLLGAQLGSVAAAMAFAGGWAERRRMTQVARRISDLAIRLAVDGTPERAALPRLLALKGAHAPELAAATRRTLEQQPAARRAIRLLGRVALIRTLL